LLCPVVIGLALLITYFASSVIPLAYPSLDTALVQMLARQLQRPEIKRPLLLGLSSTYDLTWLYVSDGSGKPLPECAAITPGLFSWSNKSRMVTYRERPFYEAVAQIDAERYLHAGMSLGTPQSLSGEYMMTDPLLLFIVPVRSCYLIFFFLCFSLLVLALVARLISRPINAIKDGVDEMTDTSSFDLNKYDAIRFPLILPTETRELKEAMRAVFVFFESEKQEIINEREKTIKWKKLKAEADAEVVDVPVQAALMGDAVGVSTAAGLSALIEAKGSSVAYADDACRAIFAALEKFNAGVLFVRESLDDKHLPAVIAACGLTDALRDKFERADLRSLLSQARLTGKIVDLGPLSLKKFGFESILQESAFSHITVGPILHNRNALGYLLALTPQPLPPMLLASAELIRRREGVRYFGLLLREQAEEQKWTDAATGLRNKAYLMELISHITTSRQNNPKAQFAMASFCISVDPAQQSESLTTMLLERTNVVLRQIINAVKQQNLALDLPPTLEIEIMRVQGLEFVMTAAMADSRTYIRLIEELGRLLLPVLNMVSPAGKLCLGLAIIPNAGETGDELLMRSRSGMYYSEENGQGPFAWIKAEGVPPDYKPSRRLTAMKGELGVLDCTELLQSIASGSRSGVLVIEDGLGKEFAMTVGGGRPVAARLGKLSGQDAIVELVVTFDAGSFNFQENASGDAPPEKKLPPLMNMLMESAMAQDYYIAARGVLRRLDLPVVAGPNISQWSDLVSKDELTERELSIMQALLTLVESEEPLTLERMFSILDVCPTYMKWRCAALLYTYGAIDFVPALAR